MSESDKAKWANDVTQAWEKVHKLIGELPTNDSPSSELTAKLQEAITEYQKIQGNRDK